MYIDAYIVYIVFYIQDEIVLPLPSIEVLAEAAENSSRRGAVLHVLETTVISWIKQIKVCSFTHIVNNKARNLQLQPIEHDYNACTSTVHYGSPLIGRVC